MSEQGILEGFRDKGGARLTIERAGLSVSNGIPYMSETQRRVVFVADEGLWILAEVPCSSFAAIHELEFVPAPQLKQLRFELTDAGRQADGDAIRLKQVRVDVSFTDASDSVANLTISGVDLMKALESVEDAARLWALVSALPSRAARMGVRVVTREGEQ